MNPEDLRFILEKGILAPSADNLQPWRLRPHDASVDLELDARHVKSFCDAGLLAPYISAGAVIENLRVAALQRGFHTSCTYRQSPEAPLKIATLAWRPTEPETPVHLAALDQRATNRKFYDPSKKTDSAVLKNLESLVLRESGFRLLTVANGDARFEALAKILGKADGLRFENERLHREFFNIIRFTAREGLETRDGLTLAALDAGPAGPGMFRLIRNWNRMKMLNRFGMSAVMDGYTRRQIRSSSALLLLVSEKRTPIDFIRGGEVMQRLWHELTLRGIASQPMEGLPIFIIDEQITGGASLSQLQREKIKELRQKFFSVFDITDENGLIMLFRIGYAPAPSDRTLRRSLDSFIFS